MKLNTKKFFSGFIVTFVITFCIHLLLFRAVNLGIHLPILLEIYAFLLALTIGHFFVLKWLFNKWPVHAGYIFTAVSFIKMGLCILYLLPYIFPAKDNGIPIALNFMTVYLVLLFFDVVFLVKDLLRKP